MSSDIILIDFQTVVNLKIVQQQNLRGIVHQSIEPGFAPTGWLRSHDRGHDEHAARQPRSR